VTARVCVPWRDSLVRGADAWRLWTRLDLSGGSGVACTKSDSALEGAAALARGRLQELDLSNRYIDNEFTNDEGDGITLAALLGVLRGSLELRKLALDGVDGEYMHPEQLQQLLAAAPTLQRLDAHCVVCNTTVSSLPLLRAEPPYGPLYVVDLQVFGALERPDKGIGAVAGARRRL
jgi:hypothetical protein